MTTTIINGKEYELIPYKPRRAYEVDIDAGQVIGRFHFIICGQMADGTNCWYKCDADGENVDYSQWYSFTRCGGRLVAICEGE